ncbi:hypothetical protein CERZMDRAFT_83631 [Cercospora zeae-maydis SCOH1-5]|uniref:Hydrophobin n=1 Tax=Cercospora zeae-maydis SCOH1-5 TaxID=717836 RepID=A0A6A6FJP3_9PEZI|nr:hypothetical protein CERZMDRAFT_83631 [Cercospora zeae-maydis SCOH1-5]
MQFTIAAVAATFAAVVAAAPGYPAPYTQQEVCCPSGQQTGCWTPGTPGYPAPHSDGVDTYGCNGITQNGLIPISLCNVLNGNQILPVNLQLLNAGSASASNNNVN